MKSRRIVLKDKRDFSFSRVSRDQTLAVTRCGDEVEFERVYEYAPSARGDLIPHPRYSLAGTVPHHVPYAHLINVSCAEYMLCANCAFRTRAGCCQIPTHLRASLCRAVWRADRWGGYWRAREKGGKGGAG